MNFQLLRTINLQCVVFRNATKLAELEACFKVADDFKTSKLTKSHIKRCISPKLHLLRIKASPTKALGNAWIKNCPLTTSASVWRRSQIQRRSSRLTFDNFVESNLI